MIYFCPNNYILEYASLLNFFSRIIPEVLGNILSDSLRKEKVLSKRDASDVLRDMFAKTEARLDEHQYEVFQFVLFFPLIACMSS